MNLLVLLLKFLAFLVPFCLSCPANFYPVLAACHACPYHTESHENSTSAHDCRCVPGFICIYYKQVRATLLVNSTLQEFQANANNVRSSLISGIANAAGVDAGHVTITGVMTRTRRVLGPDRAGSLLQVQISVVGAKRVGDLAGHLDGVVVRDSWDVVPQVMVLSIPPGISLEQTV